MEAKSIQCSIDLESSKPKSYISDPKPTIRPVMFKMRESSVAPSSDKRLLRHTSYGPDNKDTTC